MLFSNPLVRIFTSDKNSLLISSYAKWIGSIKTYVIKYRVRLNAQLLLFWIYLEIVYLSLQHKVWQLHVSPNSEELIDRLTWEVPCGGPAGAGDIPCLVTSHTPRVDLTRTSQLLCYGIIPLFYRVFHFYIISGGERDRHEPHT